MSSASQRIFLLRVTLRFVTTLAKHSLNRSASLPLSEMTSFPSAIAIFYGALHLSESHGFTVVQNVSLSLIVLVSRVSK